MALMRMLANPPEGLTGTACRLSAYIEFSADRTKKMRPCKSSHRRFLGRAGFGKGHGFSRAPRAVNDEAFNP